MNTNNYKICEFLTELFEQKRDTVLRTAVYSYERDKCTMHKV